MNKLSLFTIFAALCMAFAASATETGKDQAAEKPAGPKLDAESLCREWVNSYEEEQQGGADKVKIYRPAGSKEFPPSRFRMRYVFGKDGECKWLELSPTDGHQLAAGKWTIDPKRGDVIRIEKGRGKGVETFQVIELTKDVLKMKKLEF